MLNSNLYIIFNGKPIQMTVMRDILKQFLGYDKKNIWPPLI